MAQLLSTNVTGNLNVTSSLDVGGLGNFTANNIAGRFTGNANSYIQVDIQNIGTGANSSGDLAITGDIGNDTQYYVDMGWNNSKFSDPLWGLMTANSGYLFAANGNLYVGTSNTLNDVVLFAGGGITADEGIRVYGANSDVRMLSNVAVGKQVNLTLNNNRTTPPANTVGIFGRSVAGRMMLGAVGPTGQDTPLQPYLARNKIGYWTPPGNATTVPVAFGLAAPTANGTATARTIAATNKLTRLRRLGYVSGATAASVAGYRSAANQFTLGTANGSGGFHYVHRFAVSDAVLATTANMFIGLNTNTAAPANGAPNTVSCIGVAQLQGSNSYQLVYGGSAAQPAVNLGSYGAWTNANNINDFFELALFSPIFHSNASNTVVNWRFEKVDGTGVNVASGTIEAGAAVLPANTVLLGIQSWRTAATQAIAVGLDLCSLYIETDD